jgi:N-acetylglucosaminyldiphosphoundecaprenol N-acetyl-beta-D-mannosaminyltransferase
LGAHDPANYFFGDAVGAPSIITNAHSIELEFRAIRAVRARHRLSEKVHWLRALVLESAKKSRMAANVALDPLLVRIKKPVWVWNIPISPLTLSETVDAVGALIDLRRSLFFITANTHYAMLCEQQTDLRRINSCAAFIVADGMPLVWAARFGGSRLPERVAGSDLIFELSEAAAKKGHRLFFLGGADGVAELAARRLGERYPGLQVVGAECPAFSDLSDAEQDALAERIRVARPDLLILAFTMPKGEKWLATNLCSVNVPVGVNVGAALDFAAGRVRRAPRWMQKTGLEWAFRLAQEPRRLVGRYIRNAWFIARMTLCDLRCRLTCRDRTP